MELRACVRAFWMMEIALVGMVAPPWSLSNAVAEDGRTSKEEFERMVDKFVWVEDDLDPSLRQAQTAILESPTVTGPILLERLESADHSLVLGRSLYLLLEMRYQLPKVRSILRSHIVNVEKNFEDADERSAVLQTAMRALAKIGAPDDAPIMIPLLRQQKWFVRINAVYALQKIAGPDVIPKFERILEEHAQAMTAEALRRDLKIEHKKYSFLHEGYQAIAEIKYRALIHNTLRKRENGAGKAPSTKE